LTQQDDRTYFSSDSGAKWIRGYESLSSNYIAKIDLKYRLRSVYLMKGITAARAIEHTDLDLEKPLCETTRRPAQHTTAAPNILAFTHTAASTLAILNWPATVAV
jgi:hypothetical protein